MADVLRELDEAVRHERDADDGKHERQRHRPPDDQGGTRAEQADRADRPDQSHRERRGVDEAQL